MREVRWITPPYQVDPVPAWRGLDGGWLVASARLAPAGTKTHQLIEAAGPRHCARCGHRIVDVERAPDDDSAVCRRCGDPDTYPEHLDALRRAALDALRALQHVEAAEGAGIVADGAAGLIDDLACVLGRTQPCPACGEPIECDLAPCGDPACLSRDCERHDACESPAAPTPPGRYLPLDRPRD